MISATETSKLWYLLDFGPLEPHDTSWVVRSFQSMQNAGSLKLVNNAILIFTWKTQASRIGRSCGKKNHLSKLFDFMISNTSSITEIKYIGVGGRALGGGNYQHI